MRLNAPTSVPGPYRPPASPPGIPTQRLPSARYYIPRGNETLAEIAMLYYNNPRDAVRILNANIAGRLRDDKTPGFLLTLNDQLQPGTALLIP